MAGTKTLTMIKPGAVKHRHIGAIIDMIEKAGFRIAAIKSVKLTAEDAMEFYAEHKERPFFGELVDFMSSGPIIAAILLKENAVADFRKIIGSTDPSEAADGTIRKMFAISKSMNAIHGSDSDESAERESTFFFSKKEMLEKYL
ncbi:nucleoside-diphosphate kinase [Carboxylicivirga linearis]|uniref:Nucleoside diphosphate kinase n=1 Tax=Carboxylicivirga linearis TaxID=1628157 RepID=A0ABS5JRS3_9BACT|nr:nucleoside-diphosphate kinase [Carboxylicivirga linearis]MBS2097520.1 nucleoside-diphosphate kinase [Carboxylicivirga linearis]